MVKLNCEISTQSWKAPDKFLTLFSAISKHKWVQNPARISRGPALFKSKESSPAEIRYQLSLSLTTGQRDLLLQGFKTVQGLQQHMWPPDVVDWVPVPRCWQQGWPP